ncbi:N amino acid transport system protein [Aspergillus lentulus]|uniref:putative neutral amino acid permease n=1 Tax=Aspergillus lentulus TaxID=293939 RepID=UPI001394D54D|nr:N amino acid transport system protein [Aspergillus lentulus]GFF55600.1 N amino acid transport system protein [Aspergillus lentulus]GFG17301.1 N amino acid transport system protein [Aspergillus lentulus]
MSPDTPDLDLETRPAEPLNRDETYKQQPETTEEEPFGDEEGAEVRYRTLEWWFAAFAVSFGMELTQVASYACRRNLSRHPNASLGCGDAGNRPVGLPSSVPVLYQWLTVNWQSGVILIVGIAILTVYTGCVMGQFKARYPHVHSIADGGEVLFGWIGREVLGTGLLLCLVFVMGGHILTFSVMMNTLTDHGTCSIVFGVVGLLISLILSLPRTFKRMSWLSVISFASIVAAVLVTMIALGVQRPRNVKVEVTRSTSLYRAFLAVTDIVFAYAAHPAFFGYISEMKTPTDWPKTLCFVEIINTTLYTVTGVVIYRFAGQHVASPALGSSSPLMAKVAYGIAIPTIVIAGVINGHIACKYIYVRLFRGTEHLHQRSLFSIGTWVTISVVLWTIAWIIAEAVPEFNNLLSLVTALFCSWFSYGLCGAFWLFINKGLWFSSPRKTFLTIVNFILLGMGGCLCGLGLYASGRAISEESAGRSFSCASNA